ncbi:MAG: hypothetical protein CME59_19145 [Halioglobus sp.]|nr:hypothetical protein [Halioglobus sp.]
MSARGLGSGAGRLAAPAAWLGAALLLLLAAWVYWPGADGPEMLDDRSSLLVIDDLRAQPELAWDYVFGDRSGALGRSVSMATFVAEKRFLGHGITGHKRVNILLHCVNGALVMWLLALLLRGTGAARYRGIAVLLGAAWLLHPLLVSTVLYTVQRMAMLSATFMLLTAISYLYWRRGLRAGPPRPLLFLPVLLFFALGLLSKENTVVILPILLLLEVLWLQCRDAAGQVIGWLRKSSLALIAGGGAAALALLLFSLDYLQWRHRKRPFDLDERVLTQARLLWDYLGQWFAPQISRMGIYHDDVIWSRSLTQPLSTAVAVFAWLSLALLCVWALRYRFGRYAVFCVCLFTVGHAVESTVWPLELYFEHRNYFPALGLVLLVGVACAWLTSRWRETAAPLQVCLGAWVLVLAVLTSPLVQVWSSRPLLILHHLNGHPDSSRANLDMASQMATLGSHAAALRYSRRAHEVSFVEREGDWAVRDLALGCIAGAPVGREDIDRIGQVDAQRPLGSVTTLLTLVRMVQDDQCPGLERAYFADHLARIYLYQDAPASASTNMYSNLAVLENALGRYEIAYAYTEKLLQKSPRHRRGLLMHLHFATALQRRDEARAVIETLQALDQQGKLTVAQQQTLALYLDP